MVFGVISHALVNVANFVKTIFSVSLREGDAR